MTRILFPAALVAAALAGPVAASGMPTLSTLLPPVSIPAPDTPDGPVGIISTRGR